MCPERLIWSCSPTVHTDYPFVSFHACVFTYQIDRLSSDQLKVREDSFVYSFSECLAKIKQLEAATDGGLNKLGRFDALMGRCLQPVNLSQPRFRCDELFICPPTPRFCQVL